MTNPTRYLCVDDLGEQVKPFLEDLSVGGALVFDVVEPAGPDDLIQLIQSKPYDGVLLDYVLGLRGSEGADAPSKISNSLAQQIRDSATLGLSRDVPLVLWSAARNFHLYYDKDATGRDLYDIRIEKLDVSERATEFTREMISLSKGYKQIACNKGDGRNSLIAMLGVSLGDADLLLDPRVGDEFGTDSHPEHEYARYVLDELMFQPNPLVDEDLLAARLGMELSQSPKDWKTVTAALSGAAYTGVFSDGWSRWWWQRVDAWWEANFPGTVLETMSARTRVEMLNGVLGTTASPAKPLKEGYSDSFWATCESTNRPIDPVDALQSKSTSVQPWHDPRYISIDAALGHGHGGRSVEVHAIERNRLESLRQERDDEKTNH